MEALVAPIFCWKKITMTLQQMSKLCTKMYVSNVHQYTTKTNLRFASLAKKMQFDIVWYVDKITDAD